MFRFFNNKLVHKCFWQTTGCIRQQSTHIRTAHAIRGPIVKMAQNPEDLVKMWEGAWMKRDGSGLSALFHKNADFVNVVGLWWENKNSIEKAHVYGLTHFFRNSVITAAKTKVKYLNRSDGDKSSSGGAVGEVATVHIQWTLEGNMILS